LLGGTPRKYIYIYTCVLSMLVVPVVEDVQPKPPSFESWSCE